MRVVLSCLPSIAQRFEMNELGEAEAVWAVEQGCASSGRCSWRKSPLDLFYLQDLWAGHLQQHILSSSSDHCDSSFRVFRSSLGILQSTQDGTSSQDPKLHPTYNVPLPRCSTLLSLAVINNMAQKQPGEEKTCFSS